MLRIFFTLTAFCAALQLNAQNGAKNDLLRKADEAFRNSQYAVAAANYKQLLSGVKPDSLSNVRFKLAETYWKMRNGIKTFETYKSIRSGLWSEKDRVRFAELLARNEQYDSAAAVMYTVRKPWASLKADGFKNRNFFYADSANWRISFLTINTGYSEFAPVLYGKSLLFNSNRRDDSKNVYLWDGYQMPHAWQVSDTTYLSSGTEPETPERLHKKNVASAYGLSDNDPVNFAKETVIRDNLSNKYFRQSQLTNAELFEGDKNYYYTTPAFTNTGRIYFAGTYQTARKTTRLQLFEAEYDKRGVRYAHPLEFNDTAYTFLHPTVSPNGRLLVFASDRKDSKGGFDLYYSLKIPTGFSLPRKVEMVNTEMNEVFPYIASDGFLYFSSDGLPGMGALDIYRVRMDSVGNTSGIVEHLGFPINSGADDFGWTQVADGSKGYFSSDRAGDDNIYSFSYNAPGYTLRGVAESNEAVFSAAVLIDDLSDVTGRSSYTFIVTNTGKEFSVPLRENRRYRLTIRYKDKPPFIKYFDTINAKDKVIQLPLILLF